MVEYTAEYFATDLDSLGWKQSDFCQKTGVHRNTVGRWVAKKTVIPRWVVSYLDAMLRIQDLANIIKA